jgi:alpha-glucosidase (family GH31 glycosyl hydrolase)
VCSSDLLESAQAGDRAANLGFEHDGKQHQVTKLLSQRRTDAGVSFEYETTYAEAVARVDLRPAPGALRVTAWLLSSDGDLVPSLRYRLQPSGLWYGGGFQGFRDPQVFPLNKAHLEKNAAFLANGNTQGTPAWYTTKGVAIWVRTPHDFRYSINRADDGLLSVEMPGVSSLTYDILLAGNIREAVDRINREIGWPRSTPPADYFRLPIYTTWVEHKVPVSQEKVLEYARAIQKNKLPCGVIEIDDKWESRYGDMQFDAAKFPDPKAMNAELHKLGYRVTLWVHPFVNVDSETYADARYRPMLLRDLNGQPGLMRWWNGNAAVWDISNPKAAAEFRRRLTRLQEAYGFDGFKFDGADVNLLPQDLRSAGNITPFDYPDLYNREATSHFPWEETRVGIYSQPLGVVQRLIDKQSRWGLENGIEALVPEAITVSLRGFFYVMPDMVGGNQYDGDKISKELLIRWAQASALMPLLQFSVGPWHFDDETVRLSREASELHLKFAPYIVELAQAAPKTGQPILRPIWYNEPADREAQPITDEFMLGTDVVVAPVMKEGATSRNVYLPAGRWVDVKTGKATEGARWLKDFPAPLDTLPLFVREGSKASKF